jgi:hypothetical protein
MGVHIARWRAPEIIVTLTEGGTFVEGSTYYVTGFFNCAWIYNNATSIFSNVETFVPTSTHKSISIAWKVTVPIQSFADYDGGKITVNSTNHCLTSGNTLIIESGDYAGTYTVQDWIDYNSFTITGTYSSTYTTTFRVESAHNLMNGIIYYIHTVEPFSGDPTQGTWTGARYTGWSHYPWSGGYSSGPNTISAPLALPLYGSPAQIQGTLYPPPPWCKSMEKGKVWINCYNDVTVEDIKQACIDADILDVAYVEGNTFVSYGIVHYSGGSEGLSFTDMNIINYAGMIGGNGLFSFIEYTRCQVSFLEMHYGAYLFSTGYNSNFLFHNATAGPYGGGPVYAYPLGENNTIISNRGLGAEALAGDLTLYNVVLNVAGNAGWLMNSYYGAEKYINCRVNNGWLYMYYIAQLWGEDSSYRMLNNFYIDSPVHDITLSDWYGGYKDIRVRNVDTTRTDNKKLVYFETNQSSTSKFYFYRSNDILIKDANGNSLEDVNISLEDNQSTIYEYVTNEEGVINYEVLEQYTIQPVSGSGYGRDTFYEDWIITVSKEGYETYVGHSVNATDIETEITLKPVVKTKTSVDGNVLVSLQPELGSSSQQIEL